MEYTIPKWSPALAAVDMVIAKNDQYKNANMETSQVLLLIEEYGCKSRTLLSRRDMAVFDAAIVRLTHFAKSDLKDIDALANFAGYMELLWRQAGGEIKVPQPAKYGKTELLNIISVKTENAQEQYGDVYCLIEKVLDVYFPVRRQLSGVSDYFVWHNFELLLTKLFRFYNTGFTHMDSLVDLMAYVGIIGEFITKADDDEDWHD